MAAATDLLENAFIDWFFRGQGFNLAGATCGVGSGPTALYLALFTSNPGEAGSGTEVTGINYSRIAIPCTASDWSSTNGPATTTVPSTGTGGIISNNNPLNFPAPGGAWGTITHVALMSAPTGGSVLLYGSLSTPTIINSASDPAASYPAGTLQLTFG